MVTAWRMNDWEGIRYIFRHKFKSGISQFLITMLATVVFDLTVAFLLGVVLLRHFVHGEVESYPCEFLRYRREQAALGGGQAPHS